MDLSLVFSLCTLGVVPAWLLLAVAPGWRWTGRLVHSAPVFVLLCLAYQTLRIVRPELPEGASLTSFEGFLIVLTSPHAALVTWIHILVVDLFLGAWLVRDARRLGIYHGFVVPCLLVTFVAAPAGLLAYFVLRWLSTRRWLLDEAIAA